MGTNKVERPSVLLGQGNQLTVMFDNVLPFDWLREGIRLQDASQQPNGELRLTLVHDPEAVQPVRPSSGSGWRFQTNNKVVLSSIQQFRTTPVRMQPNGPGSVALIVPAERERLLYKPRNRQHKAKAVVPPPQPATALATLKETVKTMASESPPPGFRPAIPLREAIDTINAYVVEESGMLRLEISKRGRVKAKYEYGG